LSLFFGLTLLILVVLNSCSKFDQSSTLSGSLSKKLGASGGPFVQQCGAGQHWDFYLGKCVPDCASGYHNDSTTGKCVLNGNSNNIIVRTNSNNPDDDFGNYHNQGVATILPNINPSSPTLDADVLTQVKAFDVTLGYSADSAQTFYNKYVALGDLPFSKVPELDSLGNILVSQGQISSTANSYVQQIYSTAKTYLSFDTPTVIHYNSFANSMISLESQIQNNSSLSANEKNGLLSACSVARYSAAYWGNYINNPAPAASQISPLRLSLPKWLKIVIGDIGGAVIGIATGPVGIVTGAIGTSIVTAVTI
jgi:hypothetical protein